MIGSIFRPSIEDIQLGSSYSNFHVKGFDYLCIKRTPEHTVKIYFFEGDLAQLPELVVPHDRRYDFYSAVVAGEATDIKYDDHKWWAATLCKDQMSGSLLREYEEMEARVAEERKSHRPSHMLHTYNTPLNGGSGFSPVQETLLTLSARNEYVEGNRWLNKHNEIHTLKITRDRTILMLEQMEDRLPLSASTKAYVPLAADESYLTPSVSGLYDLMDIDVAVKRLAQYQEAMNKLIGGIS